MKTYQPYQLRVLDEERELHNKILLLNTYIRTNPHFKSLPKAEQRRMRQQHITMKRYNKLLNDRIKAF